VIATIAFSTAPNREHTVATDLILQQVGIQEKRTQMPHLTTQNPT
jgi:hypothetical protein